MSNSIGFNSSPSRLPFMDYTDDDCMVATGATQQSGFKSVSGLKFETEVVDYLVSPRDVNSGLKTAEPAQGLIVYNGHAGLGANHLFVLMADAGGQ